MDSNIPGIKRSRIEGRVEKIEDNQQFFKSEVNSFKSQLLSKGFFDVTLVIDGQEIKVHKVNLALASRKFESLFQNKNTRRYVLKEIKFEVIKSMIDFIYGKDFEPELAKNLLIAAHDYGIDDLHKAAETELIKKLTPENAFKYSFLGGKYNSSSLQDAALKKGSFSTEFKNNIKNIITQIDELA